jgi:Icc-related predicted phosphoesterase
MQEITYVTWKFPPSMNRKGKTRDIYDTKTVFLLNTDIIKGPTIIMSDLHCHTNVVFTLLDKYVCLDKFTVICAGDMAGTKIFGSDGDPTIFYEDILSKCGELYFAQGNHDLPSDDGKHQEKKLHNKIAKFKTQSMCSLNETIVKTTIGTIGGIDGTISNKSHNYKMSQDEYCTKLIKLLKRNPQILVTHDTPSIPLKCNDGINYVGNEKIYDIVSKYKPKIHIYGHCHHPTYHNLINGVNYICADSRILIMIPNNMNHCDYIKNELINEYIDYENDNKNISIDMNDVPI